MRIDAAVLVRTLGLMALGAPLGAEGAQVLSVSARPNPLQYAGAAAPAVLVTIQVAPDHLLDNRPCNVVVDAGDGQALLRLQFEQPIFEKERTVSVFYLDDGKYTIEARGLEDCSGVQRTVVEVQKLVTPPAQLPAPAGEPAPAPTQAPATAAVPVPSYTEAPRPRSALEQAGDAMLAAEAAERARCPNGPVISRVMGAAIYPTGFVMIRGSCLGTRPRVLLTVTSSSGTMYETRDGIIGKWDDTFGFATVPEMPGVPDGTVEVVVLDQRFSRGSNPIYMPFSATRVKSSNGIIRLR